MGLWQQLTATASSAELEGSSPSSSSGDSGYLRSRLEAQLLAAEAVLQLQDEIPESLPVDSLKQWWVFAVAMEDLRRHVEKAREQLSSNSWFACSCGDNALLETIAYLERWQDRWAPMIQILQAQVDDMTENGDEKEDFAQKMKNSSIVETIGQMKSNVANEKIQSAGCARLCRSKADHDQVEANGGIEQALEAMRFFPGHAGVQRNGAMFLAAFSAETRLDSKLVSLGAIKVVVDAMRKFPRSQRVQEHCVQALANISHRSNESKITSLGGIDALLSAMRTHPSAEKVQRYGCAALGNLSASSRAAKDILANGGIEVVLTAMKSNTKSCKVQSKGCYAISNFCATSEARKMVDKRHGVQAVLEAMEEHAEDAKVQEHGCVALKCLAQSTSIKEKIISLGGIRLVKGAFQHHIRVKEMQVKGMQCLKALEV